MFVHLHPRYRVNYLVVETIVLPLVDSKDGQRSHVDCTDNEQQQVNYVKYDVEGSEYEAIKGSLKIIQTHSPTLLVSLYHRSEDLYKLPLLVKELNPSYKLYLRKLRYVPAWDLNLYAVKG